MSRFNGNKGIESVPLPEYLYKYLFFHLGTELEYFYHISLLYCTSVYLSVTIASWTREVTV